MNSHIQCIIHSCQPLEWIFNAKAWVLASTSIATNRPFTTPSVLSKVFTPKSSHSSDQQTLSQMKSRRIYLISSEICVHPVLCAFCTKYITYTMCHITLVSETVVVEKTSPSFTLCVLNKAVLVYCLLE